MESVETYSVTMQCEIGIGYPALLPSLRVITVGDSRAEDGRYDTPRGASQASAARRPLHSTMQPLDTQEKYSFNQVRNRALKELAKLILVPPLLLSALTRASQTRLGYWTVPCYGLAIFISAYARTSYHDYLQGRNAKKIGGGKTIGMIPR